MWEWEHLNEVSCWKIEECGVVLENNDDDDDRMNRDRDKRVFPSSQIYKFPFNSFFK